MRRSGDRTFLRRSGDRTFMRRSGDRTDETPQDDQGEAAMKKPRLPREGPMPCDPSAARAGSKEGTRFGGRVQSARRCPRPPWKNSEGPEPRRTVSRAVSLSCAGPRTARSCADPRGSHDHALIRRSHGFFMRRPGGRTFMRRLGGRTFMRRSRDRTFMRRSGDRTFMGAYIRSFIRSLGKVRAKIRAPAQEVVGLRRERAPPAPCRRRRRRSLPASVPPGAPLAGAAARLPGRRRRL